MIRDYQTAITDTDPVVIGVSRQYIANIPKVRSKGIEGDFRFAASDRFAVNASASYTDATCVTYMNAPLAPEIDPARAGLPTLVAADLSGQQLPGVPKFAYTVGADGNLPVTPRLHLAADAFGVHDLLQGRAPLVVTRLALRGLRQPTVALLVGVLQAEHLDMLDNVPGQSEGGAGQARAAGCEVDDDTAGQVGDLLGIGSRQQSVGGMAATSAALLDLLDPRADEPCDLSGPCNPIVGNHASRSGHHRRPVACSALNRASRRCVDPSASG